MRWLWLMAVLLPLQALAIDVSALGGLPVLHEGRVKPLQTLARVSFEPFDKSGASSTELLAEALFAPADLLERKLIRIDNPALQSLLKLPEAGAYHYRQVTPALRAQRSLLQQLADKDSNMYSANERALWSLYEQIDRLTQLTGAMTLLLPLEVVLPEGVEAAAPYNYLSLSKHQRALEEQTKALAARKGDDVATYSDDERVRALLSMRLAMLQGTGRDNRLLRVVPSSWEVGEWLSPWEAVNAGKASPETAALLAEWAELAVAYREKDQPRWDKALEALEERYAAHADTTLLGLERQYHAYGGPQLPMALYALALLCVWRAPHLGGWLMGVGLLSHTLLLAARMVILERPPVSTLYESVLFVAWVAAALGASRSPLKRALGAGLAAFLLAISGLYAGEGDPMAMPIAVLNTNFWLATHVIIITAGYGAALMAGGLAHVALWRAELAHAKLLPASLIALLLVAVGTMLGGIWADQSWGRFWGWDPKENGALLIALWLGWLLHGRMTKHVSERGFAALLALTPIIVALSWFGVNLLGVGLHSYGFTEAAAYGLVGFCLLEAMLVSALYLRARRTT